MAAQEPLELLVQVRILGGLLQGGQVLTVHVPLVHPKPLPTLRVADGTVLAVPARGWPGRLTHGRKGGLGTSREGAGRRGVGRRAARGGGRVVRGRAGVGGGAGRGVKRVVVRAAAGR